MTSGAGGLIFLIGYRCTGKSTVARLLADRLGWSWLDADAVLEERAGRTIRQVFADEGEAGFRDRETAVLADLCRLRQHVVATGGGVILRDENRRRLRESGRAAWLTADAETIWRRLQEDTTTAERRPNLSRGGLSEIQDLLQVREPFYRQCADAVIDTTNRSPEQVASAVATALGLD